MNHKAVSAALNEFTRILAETQLRTEELVISSHLCG